MNKTQFQLLSADAPQQAKRHFEKAEEILKAKGVPYDTKDILALATIIALESHAIALSLLS